MSISASENSENGGAVKAAAKPPRSRLRRLLLWILIAALILFILVAISAAYIWLNRYALMEDVAINALAEEGIDGKLSIHSVSKTQAVINTLTLSANGTEFFSSDQVTIDYEWRDMLKGNSKRIILTRPKGRITLDENGKIMDSWLPLQESGADGHKTVPPNSIQVNEGRLSVISPFGTIDAEIDGEYFAPDNFSATVNVAQTKLAYTDWKIDGGGFFDITLRGANPQIKTNLRLLSLEHPALDTTNLHIIADLEPIIDGDNLAITVDAGVTFSSIVTAQLMSGSGKIDWAGHINHNKTQDRALSFNGDWSSDIKDLSIPDPIRRRDLAQTLSLSIPLGKTPIAQNFGPDLNAYYNPTADPKLSAR